MVGMPWGSPVHIQMEGYGNLNIPHQLEEPLTKM